MYISSIWQTIVSARYTFCQCNYDKEEIWGIKFKTICLMSLDETPKQRREQINICHNKPLKMKAVLAKSKSNNL